MSAAGFAIGDKVRFWPSDNAPHRWRHWGEVRAVVDDEVVVICRWVARRKAHFWCVLWIDEIEKSEHYQVRKA